MRIAVIGGGPGGLYFAARLRHTRPDIRVDLFERNSFGVTYGFGVVFSDETLEAIAVADPQVHEAMSRSFTHWRNIDVYYTPGRETTRLSSTGHAFAAISRVALLQLLADRASELGANVHYGSKISRADELAQQYDLVVAADGVNSATRTAGSFGAHLEPRSNRYIWLGTDKVFESFTFDVRATEYGVMQLHAYPFGEGSTVIIEMPTEVWHAAQPTIADCETIFAPRLDGHRLQAKSPDWISFTTLSCQRWSDGNLVLLGDAAHTAHFSIGSGTKLAMEDADALARALRDHPISQAATQYETERRPVVASTQRAAQASLEWFEEASQYLDQHPVQFGFNLLTRSRRVTYENLRMRDPDYVADLDEWFAHAEVDRGASPGPPHAVPPMFQPFRLGDLELRNRVIVSAMDMYSSVDGVPGDFHLVHLGSKAMGGAGLVMTEMVCVSQSGRITPGCAGLYNAAQTQAWQRVVDFVHQHSQARIGLQLGHSGRKGSTRLMWEGIDQPLDAGNWPLLAPSPLPYRTDSQTPHAMTESDMDDVTAQFISAARRGIECGFDLLELHCAHGYLLSSFLSPLTNQRHDAYGGSLDNRLRFPLRVLRAVREIWPGPLTVRISASDWHEGGVSPSDSVDIARAFAASGVDGIDVSCGQVVSDEQPAYGRSYQTPYADRIRHALAKEHPRVAVIAVGAISSADDVNSIILAGRADLCALGRPHLYDPHWTLHAAAEQDHPMTWPKQFAAGSRKPPSGRG